MNIEGNNNKFIAIDFETANSKRNSACSIGIAITENLNIVETKHWLVRPPELYFHPFNISIHGITEDDVKNEPTFDQLWPEIKNYIHDNLIIAHNASFDLGVLRHVLSTYDIDYPVSSYSCTWRISKKVWRGLPSHCLKSVSDHLGIEFKHHDAEEDAIACAEIAINACMEKEATSLPDLINKINLVFGYIRPGDYSPIQGPYSNSNIRISDIRPECDLFDEDHPFFNKRLVFTGTLESMSRKDAMQKVINRDGVCATTVGKTVNYLVIGIQDYSRLKSDMMSNKMRKAFDLISQGYDIEIIKEDDFLDML